MDGFIGPNSAGKTTIIGMACGLLTPAKGRVSVSDIDVLGEPERASNIRLSLSLLFGVRRI
jgi:ABC-type multidrug transport system ATPase subunit